MQTLDMLLCPQEPEIGVSSAFLEGDEARRASSNEKAYWLFHVKKNGEKKELLLFINNGEYESGLKICEKRLICFF